MKTFIAIAFNLGHLSDSNLKYTRRKKGGKIKVVQHKNKAKGDCLGQFN
jgi:hypothetical protein